MSELDVPVAGFATDLRTLTIKGPAPALSITPESSASHLRRLETERSGRVSRASIDLVQRRRLWWLASVIVVVLGATLLCLQVLGGGLIVQGLFLGGTVGAASAAGWMDWMARAGRASARSMMIGWLVITAGICSAILYLGLFSPALMVAVLVVFFVAMRNKRTVALAAYLTIAGFHGALAVSVVVTRPGLGVLQVAEVTPGKLVVLEVFFQIVLFATFALGRDIQRRIARNVQDVEQQARATGHHELLLEDARRAFEASLRAAGGGRFSHQTIGSYRLGQLLGEGSMGEIYEAIDPRSGEEAAVKLLRRELMADPRIVQRFLTEVRIISSLKTSHVVRVLETAEPGSGLPYIAMERLYGHDLWHHMKGREDVGLSLAEVDDLLRQVARGIDAAHRAGIVHRDLNPSNLFHEDTGAWKIIDFGVSMVLDEPGVENAIVGTPNFMSPEQVKGGSVGKPTDLFALGAIVYYALTGKLAFQGETLAAVAFEVAHHAPPAPTELVPELPAGIDKVIMTALAKDPRKRFETAAAFSEAFSHVVAVGMSDETTRRAKKPRG